jgi:hypothetical protein
LAGGVARGRMAGAAVCCGVDRGMDIFRRVGARKARLSGVSAYPGFQQAVIVIFSLPFFQGLPWLALPISGLFYDFCLALDHQASNLLINFMNPERKAGTEQDGSRF